MNCQRKHCCRSLANTLRNVANVRMQPRHVLQHNPLSQLGKESLSMACLLKVARGVFQFGVLKRTLECIGTWTISTVEVGHCTRHNATKLTKKKNTCPNKGQKMFEQNNHIEETRPTINIATVRWKNLAPVDKWFIHVYPSFRWFKNVLYIPFGAAFLPSPDGLLWYPRQHSFQGTAIRSPHSPEKTPVSRLPGVCLEHVMII